MGTLDLAVAMAMVISIGLQTTYLPTTLAGCSNYNGPEAVKRLFDNIVSQSGVTVTGAKSIPYPKDACRNFMSSWIIAIITR